MLLSVLCLVLFSCIVIGVVVGVLRCVVCCVGVGVVSCVGYACVLLVLCLVLLFVCVVFWCV